MKIENNKLDFIWDNEENRKLFFEMAKKEQSDYDRAFENFYLYLGRNLRKW